MSSTTAFILLVALTAAAAFQARRKALSLSLSLGRPLHCRPPYHGAYAGLWAFLPGLILLTCWVSIENGVLNNLVLSGAETEIQFANELERETWLHKVQMVSAGVLSVEAVAPDAVEITRDAAARRQTLETWIPIALNLIIAALALFGWRRALKAVEPELLARHKVEKTIRVILAIGSTISFIITIGIVLSLIFETVRFFNLVPVADFLFGLQWSPQTALRPDQVGASGAFGAVPLLLGTFVITLVAMFVAAPIGLAAAIYLSEYAAQKTRAWLKPTLEILAGIPTVVYGFFAALVIAPFMANSGDRFDQTISPWLLENLGWSVTLDIASESALAAGLVMGIMIIPFVSSLADDVINAVPQALRDGSLALGATHSETIKKTVLPAAMPGIIGALLLAISRAVGETMIVVMAAGMTAKLTANPMESMTTVTVQIVTLLLGDQEFDSAKTLAAFALGLTLFIFTLGLNIIALAVVKKYHEKE